MVSFLFQLPVLCPCESGGAWAGAGLHKWPHVWNLPSHLCTVAPAPMALLQHVPLVAACVWTPECRTC